LIAYPSKRQGSKMMQAASLLFRPSPSLVGGRSGILGRSVMSQFSGNWAFISDKSNDDSHDDFSPKRTAVAGEDEAINMIKDHVEKNRVMLYMKGNPSMPMCGFSAKVVQVLKAEGVDFSSVNVLDYPQIREGVKKFSQWPTIPQLYVNGEFIGGCDIITSMHQNGELKDVLGEEKEE